MSDVHTSSVSSQTFSSDVAFTPAVKAIQARKGSRAGYAQVEQSGGWRTEIDEKLAGFLAETNSFYLATATADGQPYIQHRGGPKGFIKGAYLRDGLCASPSCENLGRGPRGRRRSRNDRSADAEGLQGAARTGHPVQDCSLGYQLPAAHSAEIRCG